MTIRVQRPEWYNVLKLWFNRWTMQIGNGMDPTVPAASPKEYLYTRQIVTQQWFDSPSDPRICTRSTGAGPHEGDKRQITQLYIHGPDSWLSAVTPIIGIPSCPVRPSSVSQRFSMDLRAGSRRCDLIPCFFGVVDAGCVLWYSVTSWRAGQIPIIGTWQSAVRLAHQYGGLEPIWTALLGTVLLFSMVYSSAALIRHWPSGFVVSYSQTPFRILLAMPSFLPLLWILHWLPLPLAVTGVVLSEGIKILLLEYSRRHPRATPGRRV